MRYYIRKKVSNLIKSMGEPYIKTVKQVLPTPFEFKIGFSDFLLLLLHLKCGL